MWQRSCELRCAVALIASSSVLAVSTLVAVELEPVQYRNPGLTVDLGVGLWAWPLPMDFDGDGDLDLLVSSPDKPFNGTYVFENPGGSTRPVFMPPRRISRGLQNVQLSWSDGEPRVLTPGSSFPDFRISGLEHPAPLPIPVEFHAPVGAQSQKVRANQWKVVDFDGDGDLDFLIGIGDWSDYGWDDAFDRQGQWTRGPLHGFVYWVENTGNREQPIYGQPTLLRAGEQPIDVYGRPSPNLADFDGDGDLDLLCGEFLDGFTYFENQGTRRGPSYAQGRKLKTGKTPLRMDLQMIAPVAIDWDFDGDQDLIVGDEDGRVAWIEHTGRVHEGTPEFLPPVYFQQVADRLKCGALATPCGVDWDGDGDDDLVAGNTAGYLVLFENLGASDEPTLPRWAAPRNLQADGVTIRIQAGPNGSIQGPCEAKWGYTTVSAADWDHDGRPDLIVNSIWGRVQWYRNVGSRNAPQLAAARDVEVEWDGPAPKPAWNWWDPEPRQLVTQWRTTPVAIDWNRDGLCDLVMLDHEGYLVLFPRRREQGRLTLDPPQRVFIDSDGHPLRLNDRPAGGSGRRKLSIVDWDQDGQLDLLVNGKNADWYRQVNTQDDRVQFVNQGPLSETVLSSHTTSPTTVDWNRNGVPDLLIGAEDGHFYYLPR